MNSLSSQKAAIAVAIETALQFHRSGQLQEAENIYQQVLLTVPANFDALHLLGVLSHQTGNDLLAVKLIQKATKINKKNPTAFSHLGAAYRSLGRLSEAEKSYRTALHLQPDFPEAYFNLANTLAAQKRLKEAEKAYRKAMQLNPYYAAAQNNLGTILNELGRIDEAEAAFRNTVLLDPCFAEAYNNLGNTLNELGRHEEAETAYKKALELVPDYVEVYSNLAEILLKLNRPNEAESTLKKALALKPDNRETLFTLANTLAKQKKFAEAVTLFRRLIKQKPDYTDAFINLGGALDELHRYSEAAYIYMQVIDLKPDMDDADFFYSLGIILSKIYRHEEAEKMFLKALDLKPDYTEAHHNLGNLLKDMGRLEEAGVSFRRALDLSPDDAGVHCNLGILLMVMGRFEEAAASYKRALDLNPDDDAVQSNRLLSLNYDVSISPFCLLEEARKYGEMVDKKAGMRFIKWQCAHSPERLRVGLVSGDLRNHSVGFFLESVLAQIDQSRIELIAYPTHYAEDELTARIKPFFSEWKSLVGHSDEVAARMINEDAVHLLLDVSGHFAVNRLPLFACKPAPVQVTWLGYSGTTGVSGIDYLLGDPHITPAAEESHFTEIVWRLPESYICFTPPDVALDIEPLPALTNGYITFGCFNNLTKMNEIVIAIWARVLHSIPGSRLMLKANQLNDPVACEDVRLRFSSLGIDSDRLILTRPTATRSEAMASYSLVDIALDPFPYNGTTTSMEGLWMGVPFITKRGDRFASHVGESINHNADLAEWIAEDDDDYVSKALEHTSNQMRLSSLRAGMRQRLLASPLFDAACFARHLESALWGMWERWESGQGISR